MKTKMSKIIPTVLVVLFFIIYYIPLVIVGVFSFNDGPSATQWFGFTFDNYINLFTNRQIMQVIADTLFVAAIATISSLIIGTLAAIGLTKTKRRSRNLLLRANNFPVINPEIVTAIGFLLLFTAIGFQLGMTTVIIAHITFCIPYVIITVYPKIKSLDDNLIDASMDLGARPMMAVVKVIIPQIGGALFAAGVIAFTMSFDDFIISLFSAGGHYRNISIFLFTRAHRLDLTFNALSVIIMAIIVIKVVVDIIKNSIKKQEAKI